MRTISVLYLSPDESPVDITDIVERFTIETSLDSQPGKLTLSVIGREVEYVTGANIRVMNGGEGIFTGYIFTVRMTKDESVDIVAYDQTRYLKNIDTMIVKASRLDELLTRICDEYDLKKGEIENTSHVCSSRVFDRRSLWDMLSTCERETFVATNKRFVIRDNFGKLELKSIENLHTGLLIEDESVIHDYDLEVSIDKRSYSRVKIGKNDPQTGTRAWTVISHSRRIKQWGLLQYHNVFESGDMPVLAERILQAYSVHTHTLSLDCRGDFRVFAGCGISVRLDGIKIVSDNQSFVVSSCVHTVENDSHEMKIVLATDNL